MKLIRSSDNQIYKQCSKLERKKYRDLFGMYLIEGEKFVLDALACGQPVELIILRKDYEKPYLFGGAEVVFMEGKLFSGLTQTKNSQGVLAVVKKPEISRESFFSKDDGNYIVLDRLQDPGNIGTIIRTADAAGYRGVITIRGTGDLYSPKIVRAAAGSLFRMPAIEMETPGEAAAFLKEAGKRIISTCFDTELFYYDVDLRKNIGLVIGNEGNGISQELIALSDLKIKIPMSGTIDSLNASVAAGILMYESVRKQTID